MNSTLLIELHTEELPPKALAKLSQTFATSVYDALLAQQFISAESVLTPLASPRRLALTITNVVAIQSDQIVARKGPSVAASMKDGVPTKALEGFARSCGTTIDQLSIESDGKQDVYAYTSTRPGLALSALLADIVQNALKKLPIPKLMRWGDSDVQFVRPVHSLILLHGTQIVAGEVLGLVSGNTTSGHRFLSSGSIQIDDANNYVHILEEQGKVLVNLSARKELIRQKLNAAASKLNASLASDEDLLDEVCALVEWPVVLQASFDEKYLAVPQECLILTMQQNQKYFPLLDSNQKLMHHFLLVSNLEAQDSSHIIHGNERVLRARLADAEFFFNQDKKVRLDSRINKLANVLYHNKIGSQLERVQRLAHLAGLFAEHLGADKVLAQRAALLAKADLVTDMVGEFPELQGIMGMYYAHHDQEDAQVALAIEGHYHPRFSGDTLPSNALGTAVALADKLETLVGIWGIGLIPTGDKDPFALRRATLGFMRMLLESNLNLRTLIDQTIQSFPEHVIQNDIRDDLYSFALDRLKNLLAQSFDADVIDATLALQPETFNHLPDVLLAVNQFKSLPEAKALAAANKRVKNILKKQTLTIDPVHPTLLVEAAELQLWEALLSLEPEFNRLNAQGDFAQALASLASLKTPVDNFFDSVMVNADDEALRNNRLALLARLSLAFNSIADISLLAD